MYIRENMFYFYASVFFRCHCCFLREFWNIDITHSLVIPVALAVNSSSISMIGHLFMEMAYCCRLTPLSECFSYIATVGETEEHWSIPSNWQTCFYIKLYRIRYKVDYPRSSILTVHHLIWINLKKECLQHYLTMKHNDRLVATCLTATRISCGSRMT